MDLVLMVVLIAIYCLAYLLIPVVLIIMLPFVIVELFIEAKDKIMYYIRKWRMRRR